MLLAYPGSVQSVEKSGAVCKTPSALARRFWSASPFRNALFVSESATMSRVRLDSHCPQRRGEATTALHLRIYCRAYHISWNRRAPCRWYEVPSGKERKKQIEVLNPRARPKCTKPRLADFGQTTVGQARDRNATILWPRSAGRSRCVVKERQRP